MTKGQSPNPSSEDLQARLDAKAERDYQKALTDPAAQMLLENLRQNTLKEADGEAEAAASANAAAADLQAKLDKRADEDYEKSMRNPLTQERLANLNRNTLKEAEAEAAASANAAAADLQARLNKRDEQDYQKALRDPTTQMLLDNLRRNTLKDAQAAKK